MPANLSDDSDASQRRWLAALGLLAAVGLVYASIVPLLYQPLAIEEAIERFRQLRWLQLDVYKRADWVANGIVAVPFAFLLAGAADRERRWTLRYGLRLLPILIFANALIVAIEFLQLWFPIRTVSGNDIAAGCIGASSGVVLWGLVGRPILAMWQRLRGLRWQGESARRLAQGLLAVYVLVLVTYSVMPLDLMLDGAEWRAKWAAGRFRMIPELDTEGGGAAKAWGRLLVWATLSAVRFVPLGFLVSLAGLRTRGALLLIGLPVLLEALQAPVFTRYTVLGDVLCGWGGGLVGMLLAKHRERLKAWNDLAIVRAAIVLSATAGTLLVFLGRFERWATGEELAERWQAFWAVPFAKYYYGSEFSAGSNLAGKLIVFACLGAALANLWARPGLRSRVPSWPAIILSAVWVIGLGTAIELGQIRLVPAVADINDIWIYAVGAVMGWTAYRGLVNWNSG